MTKSITSANSVLTITATSREIATTVSGSTGSDAIGALAGLLGVPVTLQGWAADQAFSIDRQNTAEVVLGVDGQMHTGWVPSLVPLNVSLMPDSDSQDYMEEIFTIQKEMREVLLITGVLIIPALGKKYALSNGVLNGYTPIPSHNRVLAAQGSTITFQTITPAAY